jgi:hypothetical protein
MLTIIGAHQYIHVVIRDTMWHVFIMYLTLDMFSLYMTIRIIC